MLIPNIIGRIDRIFIWLSSLAIPRQPFVPIFRLFCAQLRHCSRWEYSGETSLMVDRRRFISLHWCISWVCGHTCCFVKGYLTRSSTSTSTVWPWRATGDFIVNVLHVIKGNSFRGIASRPRYQDTFNPIQFVIGIIFYFCQMQNGEVDRWNGFDQFKSIVSNQCQKSELLVRFQVH